MQNKYQNQEESLHWIGQSKEGQKEEKRDRLQIRAHCPKTRLYWTLQIHRDQGLIEIIVKYSLHGRVLKEPVPGRRMANEKEVIRQQ
jgi:hypothetical protein